MTSRHPSSSSRKSSAATGQAPGRAAAQEVRIIGGQWRRSKLPVARVEGLRPTPDRVRETLFNWLGQELSGWRCLDAFAGTGALGFEAASRGAAEVVLLERDALALRALQETQARLAASQVRIERADALVWLSGRAVPRFDLVLLDPPFSADLLDRALVLVPGWLTAGGLVYAESALPLDAAALRRGGWALRRQGRAGNVHYHLLAREADAPEVAAAKTMP